MIQILTAHTLEPDDAEFALEEILEQLDLENNKKQYAAGFLYCHTDFAETGVAQSIAEALPFDVVGGTTVCNLTGGMRDIAGLTISVITSDTVEFTSAFSADCHTEDDIAKVYAEASAGRSVAPSLIFPFVTSAIGDIVVSALDKLTEGKTPLLGTNALDNTTNSSRAVAIYNGKTYKEGFAMLVAWGELKAKFFVSEISEDFIQKQRAVITESEEHIIMSINDMRPADYLESIGISREQATGDLLSIPFILDMCDGTKPVARAFYGLTPEGYIVTGGTMKKNATVAIASLESDDIIRLTNKTLDSVLSSGNSKGMMLFPCVSHFWTMEKSPLELIHDKMDNTIPYHVYYSGGEICPVFDSNDKMVNRFHSFTCVACSFE